MKSIKQSSMKKKNTEKMKGDIRITKSEKTDAEKDKINEEKGKKY